MKKHVLSLHELHEMCKKMNGQNAGTSMLNALVHTMYSHYWDNMFICRRHIPKYSGCSVVSSNFFNLILIK